MSRNGGIRLGVQSTNANNTNARNSDFERLQGIVNHLTQNRAASRVLEEPDEPLSFEHIFRDVGAFVASRNNRNSDNDGEADDERNITDSDEEVQIIHENIINHGNERARTPPIIVERNNFFAGFDNFEMDFVRTARQRHLIFQRHIAERTSRNERTESQPQIDSDVEFKKLRSELEKALRKINDLQKELNSKDEDYARLKRKYDEKVSECEIFMNFTGCKSTKVSFF